MFATWYTASRDLQGLFSTAGTKNNSIHLHLKKSIQKFKKLLKLKCNAKTTLRHVIVCNTCGMPKFQWKNRLTFRDIYVQSWQNHSFPIISENTPRAWHLVVTSHMTQETNIPRVPSRCSRQACIKMSVYESEATLRWNLTLCCTNTNFLTVSCSSVVSGVTSLRIFPTNVRKYNIFFSE